MKKKHIKSSTVAMKILNGIALTGEILIKSRNPNFGFRSLQALLKKYEQKDPESIKRSIRYLKDRGYVTMAWLKNGDIKVEITKGGTKVVEQVSIENLQINRPEKWDGVWRLVIFDVPNTKSKNRLAFTQNLKNLGFQMVQKSVWAYPHPCHKEIMILRKFYMIEEFVTYLETKMVEDDELWRDRFDLS